MKYDVSLHEHDMIGPEFWANPWYYKHELPVARRVAVVPPSEFGVVIWPLVMNIGPHMPLPTDDTLRQMTQQYILARLLPVVNGKSRAAKTMLMHDVRQAFLDSENSTDDEALDLYLMSLCRVRVFAGHTVSAGMASLTDILLQYYRAETGYASGLGISFTTLLEMAGDVGFQLERGRAIGDAIGSGNNDRSIISLILSSFLYSGQDAAAGYDVVSVQNDTAWVDWPFYGKLVGK